MNNPPYGPNPNDPPQPPVLFVDDPEKMSKFGIGWCIAIILAVLIAIISIIATSGRDSSIGMAFSASNVSSTTQQLAPIPTHQPIHYPPTTEADLHGLATEGDASAIHEFHSESVGLTGVCPQPKREVTVDPSITGQQLAEDLLAYFYAQNLDVPCGSVVFAYHNQSESNDAYTAGRISVNTTDSSGADITDPNATNVKYKLTLDVGDIATGQEYVVTY